MSSDLDLQPSPSVFPDFSNTEIAFSYLSDRELKRMAWLFSMMNKAWLVRVGNPVAGFAVKWNLPFARTLVHRTLFKQFVGGQSLLDSQATIDKLAGYNIHSILDYGVEARESEEELNRTLQENLRAIAFAAENEFVPVVSTKISGLASNALLTKVQTGVTLTPAEDEAYKSVVKRVEALAHAAFEKGVSVFFDAEESWIQDPIDDLVNAMMRRYNKERPVVYNTYQLYRHDRLKYMLESAEMARSEGWMLGAKIVRGAYMEKERERAKEMGYPSPIQVDKQATDDAYNKALRFLVENFEWIGTCNATHNVKSNELMAQWIDEVKAPRDHPHLNFSQLLGMSDNLTFNLANSGYNVAKYLPYGRVQEVIPYLLRRAQENSSVTGEMSRELHLVQAELRRRGL